MSKVQPSQLNRSTDRRKREPRDRYDKNSYGWAVRRACDQADQSAHKKQPQIASEKRLMPRWHPNQLRHTAATEIRRTFGLEAAQVCLGHLRADVTQLYAERNQSLAERVMNTLG